MIPAPRSPEKYDSSNINIVIMEAKYLLGLDVGSSSVKASLVDAATGECVASAFYPEHEAPIMAKKAGWAEQQPDDWWAYVKQALKKCFLAPRSPLLPLEGELEGVIPAPHSSLPAPRVSDISAIGISYQMHGLVCVDKHQQVLRPSIIWCDSRAVPYGERAFRELGEEQCLSHLLNSPGNFTASKLAWVKENEPELFERIDKIMLPGDYIAMRLSGEVRTTVSGLSEGMLWDFQENRPAKFLLDYFGFPEDLIPEIVPTFGIQGYVSRKAAEDTGLPEGIPICYRAGDQPNNALSLNVFNPGEVASTAGTSGVVYGVLGEVNYDPKSRVNTFAHVNHLTPHSSLLPLEGELEGVSSLLAPRSSITSLPTRLGVLLCINGTGILNAWMHRNVAPDLNYAEMNELADTVPVGSEGVSIIPFGNGAERVLENREMGCSVHGLNFNKHSRAHLLRAAQEGIVFSFCYGMEVMRQMGMDIRQIHAGQANMFLSDIFRQTLATTSGATIHLMETDGAAGAAKGAGMGLGFYRDHNEAFASLRQLATIQPEEEHQDQCREAYQRWKQHLTPPP